jgi:hypothetical protein
VKRILIVLTALVALLGSSQTLASSFSFGISFQTIRYIPIPHIHLGYDFGTASEGFSLEASLFTLLFVNDLGVTATYRIPVAADGSNVYVGVGASVVVLLFVSGAQSSSPTIGSVPASADAPAPFIASAFGVIGWEAPIGQDYTYFLEIAPGVSLTSGNAFEIRFTLGLRAHRETFPTRL